MKASSVSSSGDVGEHAPAEVAIQDCILNDIEVKDAPNLHLTASTHVILLTALGSHVIVHVYHVTHWGLAGIQSTSWLADDLRTAVSTRLSAPAWL